MNEGLCCCIISIMLIISGCIFLDLSSVNFPCAAMGKFSAVIFLKAAQSWYNNVPIIFWCIFLSDVNVGMIYGMLSFYYLCMYIGDTNEYVKSCGCRVLNLWSLVWNTAYKYPGVGS